jgi:serine protease Do
MQGKVVGADPNTDVAVVRVVPRTCAVKLGDDHKLRVGEWVLAIGSPFDRNSSTP